MAPTSGISEQAVGPVPGGWYGRDLAKDPRTWRLPLPEEVGDDLLRAARTLTPGYLGLLGADPLRERPRVSTRTLELVDETRRRLAGFPGLVVLTGFPVSEGEELTELAYVVLMMLVGQPVMQRLDDVLIIRIEANVSPPGANRIGQTGDLGPHVDRAADVVGLLCVRPAQRGGVSMAVSSKTIYNVMLDRHPELLAALCEPLPLAVPPQFGPDGEVKPRWTELPVFCRTGDHFASYFNRRHIEGPQEDPDAPRITPEQAAAVDAADEVSRMPELQLEMRLRPGDLQLINNLAVAHSRTAYDDDDQKNGRLLLRMHAAFGGSPELPPGYAAIFGSSKAGTYRGGLWQTPEIQKLFGAPLPMAPV